MIVPDDPRHAPFAAAVMSAAGELGCPVLLIRPAGDELPQRRCIAVAVPTPVHMLKLGLLVGHLAKTRPAIDAAKILAGPSLVERVGGDLCAYWRDMTGSDR